MKDRRGDAAKPRHVGNKQLARVSASPRSSSPLITLITDFGTADYFVGAVKGVILSENPAAQIVDITHDIPAQDIEAAAFTLLAAYKSFPEDTIHVAVVDPGVGSSRKPLLIKAGGQVFVGPDNGIFSYICEQTSPQVFQITNTKYFRQPVSSTFHGRDIFAPVAAMVSKGIAAEEFGPMITDFVRLKPLAAEVSREGKIKGRVIHIDRFGNCITNISQSEINEQMIAGGASLRIKGKSLTSFRKYFGEETGNSDEVFCVWGSAGFLEIAALNKSAAELLNVQRGDPVIVSTE